MAAAARPRWTPRLEWAVAAVLTVFVVALHIRHAGRAGPLWRDEIGTVEIANAPAVGDWYRYKVNDWAPLGWDAVVRAWTWAGPGRSDGGLRLLVLGVGLGTTAALWANARLLGARTPVASLVLLGFNGLAICYGDSLRAYGPGMFTGLVMTGAMFHLARADGRRRTAIAAAGATLTAVAATHASYFDAPWVLAACGGAATVCGLNRRWRRAVGVLGIGAACAASLAVYVPIARARAGMRELLFPTTVARVFEALDLALARLPMGDDAGHTRVWQLAVTVAVIVGAAGWLLGRRSPVVSADANRQRDARAFSLVTLLVGIAAYAAMLRVLRDYLAYFHYLILFALIATCADGLLATQRRRLVTVALAVAVAAWWAADAWRAAGLRLTNVDLVADELARRARPGDLIVADPWWFGPSLARYYHGPGDVVTVPPMPPSRFQRFDLQTATFDDPHAIDPLLDRLAAATRDGRGVWVVIHPVFQLKADPRAESVPTAAWDDNAYYGWWTRQVASALDRGGYRRVRVLPVDPAGLDVNPYEDLLLLGPTR